MEYRLKHLTLTSGAIPLAIVAETMATTVATHDGALPFHRPAYDNVLSDFEADLLEGARSGRLAVCDNRGAILTADTIAEIEKKYGNSHSAEGEFRLNASHIVCTTAHFLNDWRRHLGDTFVLVDMPVKIVEFDLTNEDAKVVAPKYYRGSVGLITEDQEACYERLRKQQEDPVQKEIETLCSNHRNLAREISKWENIATPTALDMAKQQEELKRLHSEFAPLDSQLRALTVDYDFPESVDQATQGQTNSAADDRNSKMARLREMVLRLAQEVGEQHWKSGTRQITPRSVSEGVARKLEGHEDAKTQRGYISASRICSDHLRPAKWQFQPPKSLPSAPSSPS
jgi:hypothetical protein